MLPDAQTAHMALVKATLLWTVLQIQRSLSLLKLITPFYRCFLPTLTFLSLSVNTFFFGMPVPLVRYDQV